MRISIASDHAGFELKEWLKKELSSYSMDDFGTSSLDSVDYPDFIHPLALNLGENPGKLGIIICGSGNGVAMTANKHKHIRAALCWNNEIAEMARQHNNANVISIPARYLSKELALRMVRTFLTTEFEGGRHQRRVGKINC
jgi:ribose 5-phosphate isomerase B